jgi:hypothetical protein
MEHQAKQTRARSKPVDSIDDIRYASLLSPGAHRRALAVDEAVCTLDWPGFVNVPLPLPLCCTVAQLQELGRLALRHALAKGRCELTVSLRSATVKTGTAGKVVDIEPAGSAVRLHVLRLEGGQFYTETVPYDPADVLADFGSLLPEDVVALVPQLSRIRFAFDVLALRGPAYASKARWAYTRARRWADKAREDGLGALATGLWEETAWHLWYAYPEALREQGAPTRTTPLTYRSVSMLRSRAADLSQGVLAKYEDRLVTKPLSSYEQSLPDNVVTLDVAHDDLWIGTLSPDESVATQTVNDFGDLFTRYRQTYAAYVRKERTAIEETISTVDKRYRFVCQHLPGWKQAYEILTGGEYAYSPPEPLTKLHRGVRELGEEIVTLTSSCSLDEPVPASIVHVDPRPWRDPDCVVEGAPRSDRSLQPSGDLLSQLTSTITDVVTPVWNALPSISFFSEISDVFSLSSDSLKNTLYAAAVNQTLVPYALPRVLNPEAAYHTRAVQQMDYAIDKQAVLGHSLYDDTEFPQLLDELAEMMRCRVRVVVAVDPGRTVDFEGALATLRTEQTETTPEGAPKADAEAAVDARMIDALRVVVVTGAMVASAAQFFSFNPPLEGEVAILCLYGDLLASSRVAYHATSAQLDGSCARSTDNRAPVGTQCSLDDGLRCLRAAAATHRALSVDVELTAPQDLRVSNALTEALDGLSTESSAAAAAAPAAAPAVGDSGTRLALAPLVRSLIDIHKTGVSERDAALFDGFGDILVKRLERDRHTIQASSKKVLVSIVLSSLQAMLTSQAVLLALVWVLAAPMAPGAAVESIALSGAQAYLGFESLGSLGLVLSGIGSVSSGRALRTSGSTQLLGTILGGATGAVAGAAVQQVAATATGLGVAGLWSLYPILAFACVLAASLVAAFRRKLVPSGPLRQSLERFNATSSGVSAILDVAASIPWAHLINKLAGATHQYQQIERTFASMASLWGLSKNTTAEQIGLLDKQVRDAEATLGRRDAARFLQYLDGDSADAEALGRDHAFFDLDKDGRVTRAEYESFDPNKDGRVTRAEYENATDFRVPTSLTDDIRNPRITDGQLRSIIHASGRERDVLQHRLHAAVTGAPRADDPCAAVGMVSGADGSCATTSAVTTQVSQHDRSVLYDRYRNDPDPAAIKNMDANGDGVLSRAEFDAFYERNVAVFGVSRSSLDNAAAIPKQDLLDIAGERAQRARLRGLGGGAAADDLVKALRALPGPPKALAAQLDSDPSGRVTSEALARAIRWETDDVVAALGDQGVAVKDLVAAAQHQETRFAAYADAQLDKAATSTEAAAGPFRRDQEFLAGVRELEKDEDLLELSDASKVPEVLSAKGKEAARANIEAFAAERNIQVDEAYKFALDTIQFAEFRNRVEPLDGLLRQMKLRQMFDNDDDESKFLQAIVGKTKDDSGNVVEEVSDEERLAQLERVFDVKNDITVPKPTRDYANELLRRTVGAARRGAEMWKDGAEPNTWSDYHAGSRLFTTVLNFDAEGHDLPAVGTTGRNNAAKLTPGGLQTILERTRELSAMREWEGQRQNYQDRTSVTTAERVWIAMGATAVAVAKTGYKEGLFRAAGTTEEQQTMNEACVEFTAVYGAVRRGYHAAYERLPVMEPWTVLEPQEDAKAAPPLQLGPVAVRLAQAARQPGLSVRTAARLQFAARFLDGDTTYLDPSLSADHVARQLFADDTAPRVREVLDDVTARGSPKWLAYVIDDPYQLLAATIVLLDATAAGCVAATLLNAGHVLSTPAAIGWTEERAEPDHKQLLLWTIFCAGLVERIGFLARPRDSLATAAQHRQRILNCAKRLGIHDSLRESVAQDWHGVWEHALGRALPAVTE